MKSEDDFSASEQGKFYHPNATFHYPIYLEPDVEAFVTKIADHKKIEVQALVKECLSPKSTSVSSITGNISPTIHL